MPITKKQFELGIDQKIEDWMRKIHAFLLTHKNQAFSMQEIEEGLGVKNPGIDRPSLRIEYDDFEDGLRKLTEIGAAGVRKVTGILYYSYEGGLYL